MSVYQSEYSSRHSPHPRRDLTATPKPPSAVSCPADPIEVVSHLSSAFDRPDSPEIDVPDNPGAIFRDVIEQNDQVCRNCYRRLRTRERYPNVQGDRHHDRYAFVDYELPSGSRFDVLDRVYYEDVELPGRTERAYPPADQAASGSRACWNCGAIDYHRTPPTRSKRGAVEAAINVSITLHEFGIDHDWLYLVGRVQDLKSQPSTAGDDFACFGRAVSEAVDAARLAAPN